LLRRIQHNQEQTSRPSIRVVTFDEGLVFWKKERAKCKIKTYFTVAEKRQAAETKVCLIEQSIERARPAFLNICRARVCNFSDHSKSTELSLGISFKFEKKLAT
jgi:hypothetical protein